MEYPLVYEGMPEIWLTVVGYEERYKVSSYGRVRSVDSYYSSTLANGKVVNRFIKGRVLSILVETNGYIRVPLSKNKKSKKNLVHRLVAGAFLENINNYKQVNHKKGNRSDNRAWMLEWCTSSMNHKHAFLELGRKGKSFYWKGKFGKDHVNSIKVEQRDISGKLIKVFDSCRLAAAATGAKTANISKCLNGTRNTAAGFKWVTSKNLKNG